jgi:4-carboxymuconolactone decarboxylase
MPDLQAKGMQTRRKVLGEAHVARADANKTTFDAPFQALITDAAWGHVWSRGTIPLRERSMLTIALLAALGNDHELAMHIRATSNTGASESDVMEALLHVAIYAGVPRANQAIKIAKETFAAMREDTK